jgi:hypothetical protein
MRNGVLGAILLWLAGAGWVMGQGFGSTATLPPPPPPPLDNAFDESQPGPPPNAFADPSELEGRSHPVLWATGEFINYWLKPSSSSPLLTSGSFESLGILGRPGTQVLFQTADFGINSYAGGRATVGGAFGHNHALSAEAVYFGLQRSEQTFAASSNPDGRPFHSRPIANANTGEETVLFVTFPDQFAGNIAFTATTYFYGAEANVGLDIGRLKTKYNGPQFLVGFRYLNLHDELEITQSSRLLINGLSGFNGQVVRIPDMLTINDHFDTRNQFLGPQVGARIDYNCGKIFTSLVAKVAVGPNFETLQINGSTTRTGLFGFRETVPGGLLALSSNIGEFSHNELSIVPEVGINFGFHITDHLHIFAGYNFLYWSRVIQPGHSIDHAVNPGLLPTSVQFGSGGVARPAPLFDQTDFWAHGFNVGFALVF